MANFSRDCSNINIQVTPAHGLLRNRVGSKELTYPTAVKSADVRELLIKLRTRTSCS